MWTPPRPQFRFCPNRTDIRHRPVLSHVTQDKTHLTKTIKQSESSLIVPIKNAFVLCVFKERKKKLYKVLQGAMAHL